MSFKENPQQESHVESFFLYVEGPSDRVVLDAWARLLAPQRVRALSQSFVIMGGRRPERAVRHFRDVFRENPTARGICVLDRDDEDAVLHEFEQEGLEFFTWNLRHIESYLLVPDAIRRTLRISKNDRRFVRAVRNSFPDPGNEKALRHFDAKRLLGRHGVLASELGCVIPLGRLARALRIEELHEDVHHLFEKLELALVSS